MIFAVITGIVICVALSALFSSSEMSFLSYNQVRMENEAEKGNKKARFLQKLEKKHDDTISAILIGNNLVNTAASSLTTVLVILVTGEDALNWLGTVVVTVAVIIFGETIPKILSKRYANKYAQGTAGFLYFISVIFYPLNLLVVFLTNLITSGIKEDKEDEEEESVEELQSIIETAEDEGVLDSDQSELVSAAIDFQDKAASDVMTARVDVQGIDIEDSREEILRTCIESNHSRLPVFEGSIDHVIGTVHLNHLLKAFSQDMECDIRSLLMEPCYIYRTLRLPQVLETLRASRQHLAIVTDEYSGTLGVITMEDVLEQLVGDIWDETDVVEEEVVQISEDVLDVDGDMIIDDFLELTGIDEDSFDYESQTVGGWVIEYTGGFPSEGDSFHYENFTVTVLKMDERRVEKLRITIDKNDSDSTGN